MGEVSPEKAAELAAQAGVRIYTVGVGAEVMEALGWFGGAFGRATMNPSADLDEATLTRIAEQTGGRYFPGYSTLKNSRKSTAPLTPWSPSCSG